MKRLQQYKLKWTLDKMPRSIDKKDKVIFQLIAETANDANSSKLREDVTKWMVGLESSESKHGYDDDFSAIEVKPKNYTGHTKLNGGGQFTDFTWKRDKKYAKDKVNMLVSGFCYGKLVFIVEFPYKTIRNRIRKQLSRILPNGDKTNRYVRSASFSYLDWKDSDFNIRFLSPKMEDYKESMVSGLYNTLVDTDE